LGDNLNKDRPHLFFDRKVSIEINYVACLNWLIAIHMQKVRFFGVWFKEILLEQVNKTENIYNRQIPWYKINAAKMVVYS